MASLPGKVSPHAYEEIQKDYCKNIRLEVPRKSREIFCDAGTVYKIDTIDVDGKPDVQFWETVSIREEGHLKSVYAEALNRAEPR